MLRTGHPHRASASDCAGPPFTKTLSAMKIAVALVFVGAALFAFAFTMPPYKDEKAFMERYMQMGAGQSKDYWKLRDEMLTPRV